MQCTCDLLKDLSQSDVEKVTEQFENYVAIIKKKVIPYINASSISRENQRKFMRSLQKLNRMSKRVKVEKTKIVDLKMYTPSKLLPIIALMEEGLSWMQKYMKKRYPMHARYEV